MEIWIIFEYKTAPVIEVTIKTSWKKYHVANLLRAWLNMTKSYLIRSNI